MFWWWFYMTIYNGVLFKWILLFVAGARLVSLYKEANVLILIILLSIIRLSWLFIGLCMGIWSKWTTLHLKLHLHLILRVNVKISHTILYHYKSVVNYKCVVKFFGCGHRSYFTFQILNPSFWNISKI